MRGLICTFVLLTTIAGASTAARQMDSRFQGMDRDNDGVVTRSEWRGSDRSFERHDWNGDGVLSGDEVRPGRRESDDDRPASDEAQSGELRDWTEERFNALDRDDDGRLSRSEWPYRADTFRRVDRDGDDTISRREFLGLEPGTSSRRERFDELDTNHDGQVSRQEWRDSADAFRWLDRNQDGVLTRSEVTGASERRSNVVESRAYREGYERGLADGRKAGREDKQLRNQWDLDGQRELEQADAGYRPEFGSREEYQEGYREAFRIGYREGFGPR